MDTFDSCLLWPIFVLLHQTLPGVFWKGGGFSKTEKRPKPAAGLIKDSPETVVILSLGKAALLSLLLTRTSI